MTTLHTIRQPTTRTQRGAVLAVSLLILLLLTIIGIAGMSVTSLEERMAGNDRDRQMAFQAAEAALRNGEDYVATNNLPGNPLGAKFAANCQDQGAGMCLPATSGTANVWTDSTLNVWGNAARHRTYSYSALSGLAAQPIYIIEYLGPQIIAPQTAVTCSSSPSPCPQMYRITAIGYGGTPNAKVVLQSVYKKTP